MKRQRKEIITNVANKRCFLEKKAGKYFAGFTTMYFAQRLIL